MTSTVPERRTLAVGRREWIPSCSANFHISVETDENAVFRNWFGFFYDAAEEWLDQAASTPGTPGEAVPERRERDKAL